MTAQHLSTNELPLVIAHRGVSGRALENSIAAFKLAVVEKCDGVELDIHTTADGELVVHHDPAVGGGEAISSLPLSAIRRIPLSDGSIVPTLAEALAITGTLQVFIETKTLPDSADRRLIELISTDPRPERLHIHAFDHRIIARLAVEHSGLSLGILSSSYPVDPIPPVLAAGATVLWQEWQLIDSDLVERCREVGIGVVAWTVNSETTAARLTRLGVAGLCGNWPDKLRRGIQNVKGAP